MEQSKETAMAMRVLARLKAAQDGRLVAQPMADYSQADQAFYRFWYSHMQNDLMQPPLSNVSHSVARYIWDSAKAEPIREADNASPRSNESAASAERALLERAAAALEEAMTYTAGTVFSPSLTQECCILSADIRSHLGVKT